MAKAPRIALVDAVEQLRRELHAAIEAGDQSDLRFELKEIELNLQVVAEKAAEGSVGAKFFLDFGVKGQKKDAITHGVKLRLIPRRPADLAGGTASSEREVLLKRRRTTSE